MFTLTRCTKMRRSSTKLFSLQATQHPKTQLFLMWLQIIAVIWLFAVINASVDAQDNKKSQETKKIEETIAELKRQYSETQKQAAELAGRINVAQASTDELIASLNTLQQMVDTEQDKLNALEAASKETDLRLEKARYAVATHEAKITHLRDGLNDSLIDSYISFQSPAGTSTLLGNNPWRTARAQTLVEFASGKQVDVIDELRRAGLKLKQLEIAAEEANVEAQQRASEMSEQLAAFTAVRNIEADLTAKAEEKLETLLQEGRSLKTLDAELAAKISAETRRLAATLERERRKREEADRARANPSSDRKNYSNTKLNLVSVRGIVVDASIADDTENLLTAMEAEGFKLGGGGYRSNKSQIYLRKAHCGTSEYAVWQMPASKCRPPTARPGRSDHERGRAIDFTYKGRIISSRKSAVFKTLKRVAPKYGFVNLPSEPWHWSNT